MRAQAHPHTCTQSTRTYANNTSSLGGKYTLKVVSSIFLGVVAWRSCSQQQHLGAPGAACDSALAESSGPENFARACRLFHRRENASRRQNDFPCSRALVRDSQCAFVMPPLLHAAMRRGRRGRDQSDIWAKQTHARTRHIYVRPGAAAGVLRVHAQVHIPVNFVRSFVNCNEMNALRVRAMCTCARALYKYNSAQVRRSEFVEGNCRRAPLSSWRWAQQPSDAITLEPAILLRSTASWVCVSEFGCDVKCICPAARNARVFTFAPICERVSAGARDDRKYG